MLHCKRNIPKCPIFYEDKSLFYVNFLWKERFYVTSSDRLAKAERLEIRVIRCNFTNDKGFLEFFRSILL